MSNQRIAEIDGYTEISTKPPIYKSLRPRLENNCLWGNPSPDRFNRKIQRRHIPDYENNTAELIRVAIENDLFVYMHASRIGAEVAAKPLHISIADPEKLEAPITVAKINAALVAAIIEARNGQA